MTELKKDSTVSELLELFNSGKIKYQHIQDTFSVSRDLIKDRLTGIGYTYSQIEKKFVGEATEDNLNTQLSQLFEKQRGNKSPKVRTNKLTNVGTKEQTNVRTNVKEERTNEPTKEQSKERTNVIRKRSSFDIDVELMKELKIKAIIHNRTVYEIVETAVRQYLKTLK